MQVLVEGRDLGTASGWDEVADWIIYFYAYQPNAAMTALGVPAGGLTIDHVNGVVEVDDEQPFSNTIFNGDLITLLRDIPKA